MFPVTFRLLLTWRSFAIVTFPGSVGLLGIEITGVEPSPEVTLTLIWFAVPVID